MSEQGRIEQDLARTRSRMNDRLTDLQARLTPDRIIDDVVGYVKGSDGGEFARNLIAGAKRNPIPTALAGIGLAWLMAANSRDRDPDSSAAGGSFQQWRSVEDFDDHVGRIDGSVTRNDGEDELTYADRLHDARGKALGVARGVQDTTAAYAARLSEAMESTRDGLSRRAGNALNGASDLGRGIGDRATDLRRNAGENARYASDRLTQGGRALQSTGGDMLGFILESPIALGAIGVGVGALLGALLPQPEAEGRALGGVARQARSAVRDGAQEIVDRGADVARQTLAAGKESARTHGLGGDKDLGALVREAGSGRLSGSAAEVAKDVLKAADGSIKQSTGSAGEH